MSEPAEKSDLAPAAASHPAWLGTDRLYRMLIESVSDYAIFLLDTTGRIVSWNIGAEKLKGYAADEIIGQHVSRFYTEPALKSRWPEYELEVASRTGRFEDEGWRVRKDGSRFWANVIISAVRDEHGTLVGFSKVTRDLTERKRNEEMLKESEERFRLLLEGVQDYAICMLDTQGVVTSWNAGAERITGYRAEEMLGKSFVRFYPEEDTVAGRPAEMLRGAMQHGRAEDHGWRLRKDGTRFWAHVVVTASYDRAGTLRGFAKVTRDLSERKRMEDLEQEGRNSTEFIAMLAHELRNPLAPIHNAVALLDMVRHDPAQVALCREIIQRQAGHLTRLVDDLLDVGRIASGKIAIRSATMDLGEAVRRAVEAVRPLLDERRHHLRVALRPDPTPVHGDLTRLTQVVLNLLNNAAKFTPAGGYIDVSVKTEGANALVEVVDTGAGIRPEMLDQIFELFTQGQRDGAGADGGLGIGLTLARRIAELHGGTLIARSDGPGRGAAFTFTVPLFKSVGYIGLQDEPARLSPSTCHQSVLLVDDNRDAAHTTGMLLRALGHEVTVRHDGLAALQFLEQTMPQVVLLDIGLPGLNGYEVARRLRAMPGGERVRLYAMTGYGQEEDQRRSAAAGFDGHLVKPLLPQDLVAALEAG